jgi:cytidylate kinase
MVITIDGHAGAGKSSVARLLAVALGFELLNTGAMYRAAAYALGRAGLDIDADPRDAAGIAAAAAGWHFDLSGTRVRLNGEDLTDHIYTDAMGQGASRVGTFREVRERLKAEQRRLAAGRDVICEGRDQGTAVFPDAPVKFFLTASPETRAARQAEREGGTPDRYLQSILDRDRRDEGRDLDPLKMAADAVRIDSSSLSMDEVLARMVEVVERCRSAA